MALDDQRAIAWRLLGAAVGRQCRYEEALQLFAHADKLSEGDADDATAFTNYAIALSERGRVREALEVYERYLPRFPFADGHYPYALALLTAGRLAEGWRHYEFRWLKQDAGTPRHAGLAGPVWGGQAVRGKTVLIHVEQGFGDVIQFVRYAAQVKALGATVLLRVARPMKTLMRGIEGIDRVLDRDEVIPAYDFYIHLLSLSRVFGTTLDSIPANIPYIRTDDAIARRWAARLPAEGVLRVGVAWAGNTQHPNDRFRSMDLSQLKGVLEVGGVRFVSLQKGEVAATAGKLPAGVDWMDVGAELEDFSDTAAVISQLDLVLCVDTAVAHLAGALGKPVWVMVAQPADFRWLEEREDSPWYPTLRLFRQSRRDDWSDVVAQVKAALEERVREGPSAPVKASTSVKPVTTATLPWTTPAQLNAGHRPGLSAVAETRVGILQYLPDEPIVGDAIGWYGEYLQPQLDLLARIVRPGSTVLEVGAGVGAHAVFLGRVLGESGHLLVYESRPVLQRILRQNLAANGLRNVTVMRRLLGSQGEGEGAEPTSETLDELQLERLDWLKVNAGVAAQEILAGASETLWRLRPLLFLAAPDEQGLRALTERAREFGYRCWRMETALFNRQNFNRREADIFAGAKAAALLAIPEEIEVDITLDECIEIS
jgi:precorrin-6B methylase 2